MTTWYVDYEGGTDAAASIGTGDSFATRRKKIDNISTGAVAGDTIRVMGSPAPTSLGQNGTWTNGPISKSVAIVSSTNATPIVVTVSDASYDILNPSVGHTIVVYSHTTNTAANGVWKVSAVDAINHTLTLVDAAGNNSVGNGTGGATGRIRNITSQTVTLASECTKNIALYGNTGQSTKQISSWTASTNITLSVAGTAGTKEAGVGINSFAIAAGFTTGLAAYWALPSSTDFSGYQQISFWIRQASGTVASASDLSICLCSDTAGATPVDTLNIPGIGANGAWLPVTINKGSALGATIQSIAIYVNVDRGAQTFYFDNIIACKDATSNDSLTLHSLIGLNDTDNLWYAIQSINGTRVVLDGTTGHYPGLNPNCGYFGTTQTATTYKREPILTTPTGQTTTVFAPAVGGSEGSPITISGGWDRTNMSTQTLATYFSGQNGNGHFINISAIEWLDISKINAVRYYIAFRNPGNATKHAVITCDNIVSCSYVFINYGAFYTVTIDNAINSVINLTEVGGINNYSFTNVFSQQIASAIGNKNNFTIGKAYGCYVESSGAFALATESLGSTLDIDEIKYHNYAFSFGSSAVTDDLVLRNCTIGDNLTGAIDSYAGDASGHSIDKRGLILQNCTITDAVEVANYIGFSNSAMVYSHNHDNTQNNHHIWLQNGKINTTTSVRHTDSGIAWQISPESTTYCTSYAPLIFSLAKVACLANVQRTVKLWMRRSNTGLTASLVCKGKQIAGVSADVSTAMTASADTWQQVSISFTPTETGVVEITTECYGGSTYSLYVDDFSVV